jgi:hypothetical protein
MHPLSKRVRLVGRRSERLLLCYSVSCFLSFVVAVGFVLGLTDYLIRYQDAGIRTIASILLLGAMILGYVRFLRPAIHRQLTDLEVARHVENRFPQLQNCLSSAVAFLQQPPSDLMSGSPELKRAVIEQAAHSVSGLDLMDCVDAKIPRRAAVLTLLLLVLVGTVCYPRKEAALLAGKRMLIPWAAASWPRWNSLSFAAPPQKIAAGDDFEVELIDLGGRLPERAIIQYWFSGETEEQAVSRPMKRLSDRMVDRYPNVSRSFRYRASGGDDDTMPWHSAEVVESPEIEQSKIELQPPPYSRQPVYESGRHIRALEGTAISITADVNKPLAGVAWKSDLADEVFDEPPDLAEGGRTFSVPAAGRKLVARETGTWWFTLTDVDGIVRDEAMRCELQVIADQAPSVVVESPERNTFFSANAVVPLRALVRDDLEIDAVELRFRGQVVRLTAEGSAAHGDGAGDARAVEFDWILSEVGAGDVLEYELVARDFKPQDGSSGVRRLTIVSSEELARRLQLRRYEFQQQLEEALDAQRSVLAQVESTRRQLDDKVGLSGEDLDLLQSSELNQRHVRRQLYARPGGLLDEVERWLVDIDSNQVKDSRLAAEMRPVHSGLGRLEDKAVPGIEERLASALKAARHARGGMQPDAANRSRLEEELVSAAQLQGEVIAQLEKILAEMQQMENASRISRQLGRLQRAQDELTAATRAVPTVAQDPRRLAPQQAAGLRRLGEQQRQLAMEADRLQLALADAAEDVDRPMTGDAVRRALGVAQETMPGGMMREAAQRIEANRIGQAVDNQQRAQRSIEAMLEALIGAPPAAASRDPAGNRNLQEKVAGLRDRQVSLLEETRLAGPSELSLLERLADAQQAIGEDTLGAAREISDQPAMELVLRGAGRRMVVAADRLSGQDASDATQRMQASAARRLEFLLSALARHIESEGAPWQGSPSQAREETGGGNSRVSLLELELLKEMQVEIQRRTEELNRDAVDASKDVWNREVEEIERDQKQLAEILSQLGETRPTNQN